MKFIALLALAVCAVAQVPIQHTSCCTAADGCVADIAEVLADPDPTTITSTPSEVEFIIRGSVSANVTVGTYRIQASALGIPVLTDTGSVCDLTACPLDPSQDIEIKYVAPISLCPPFGAPVSVVVEADGVDGKILCINFSFNVGC